ncbi:MAG: phosphate ABC transporter permease subunit PstC [Phycisphaeraceae bacterium]|nr:MAG: phosphate ABC transporter permease subunit PstC [Phycisphaeraceae bacterium]
MQPEHAFRLHRRPRRERAVRSFLFACAAVSIFTTLAIIVLLTTETVRFFALPEVSPLEFLFGTQWNPLTAADKQFGVLPLVTGTLLVAGISALVSIPLGVLTAVYLSEYAPKRLRAILKPALEILAGIPTVVYGFFAITVITPALAKFIPGLNAFNALSAGIAMGIMCLPIVSSLSEDALRAVPRSLREGAYAVGGTKFDVIVKVVIPAALSGIIAAFLLAIARAVGETMIVALAAGNRPNLTADPTQPVQTMTAYIVSTIKGETPYGSIERQSIFAVGALLFLLTLLMTIAGNMILRKFREVYE